MLHVLSDTQKWEGLIAREYMTDRNGASVKHE